ncbi:hypothetical protein JYU34_013704 [Plutella xylostella]|uniref:Uncharacterized protein n=2 Tax=Plutella xylostella TaxID=51655 RepID=A0ABQ7QBS1_PLUXY|nr:upstream stimulatory factor 2 isoform X1 [Plutella xylostella]XP_048483243.1 upstream stimulatory factor 2 isoform X3 [Plutella xylostella]KAG7302224.1 hypothetical protein JYU34_013704 [Plutella xylostella]CAG9123252.1 unnamed protein product [Plutella xylostella]
MSKVEIDIPDNSLDNSGDGELLGMVDEGSFDSAEDRNQMVSQSFIDGNEEDAGHYFKDIGGAVTYRFVPMTSGEETISDQASGSPTHVLANREFYVIGNSVDVFGSSSNSKKPIRRDPMQAKVITTKKRDDKRRATHNEVERRRRDKINTWISRLAALIPSSGLPDSASKGGILAKACDYITELTTKQKKFEKLEIDNEKLVMEVLKLNQELTELRKENSSLRSQMVDNCIVLTHRPKNQKS